MKPKGCVRSVLRDSIALWSFEGPAASSNPEALVSFEGGGIMWEQPGQESIETEPKSCVSSEICDFMGEGRVLIYCVIYSPVANKHDKRLFLLRRLTHRKQDLVFI